MKGTLHYLLLAFPLFTFAQPITVSTNSHTVPQLVNNVLINSPCVSAANVTWRTGTNFGSSNGIGYFQNTNPGFPLQSGVILSTGNALNAAGPNTSLLNDGNPGWTGDTDLQEILSDAGISTNTINATVLEFDFTPISTRFALDFIFASEEYGAAQCQFSDGFAMILTNMNTGISKNVALVPETTIPISVVSVHDAAFNNQCPSVNAQYFGSFNGGTNAPTSATNFNGQTVVFHTHDEIVANTPYHLKIVIADTANQLYDSALFIGANSMNIGQQVLGPDYTVANGNAFCEGENYFLSTGLDPAVYTFTWKKDGEALIGQTGSEIVIDSPGVYEVTYNYLPSSCLPTTDSIVVEFMNCNLQTAQWNNQSVAMYPNPTTGIIHFDSDQPINATLEIFNNLGQRMLSQPMPDRIDLTHYGSGIYLAKITTPDFSETKKIIVR